ncbi:MAG: PrsW family intramembrane metalloprotease, partial [Chloroflexota bacterium]
MFVFAAILYWIDRYEKEPKRLLIGAFVWGAAISAGFAFILNTFFGIGIYLVTGSEIFTEITTSSLVAPPVEETLKGLAVLLVFLAFHNEFDSTLDGIIYAGITALGFAATENVYYIYNYGYLESGFTGLMWLTFVRVFLVGWQHPFYTAFIGIGLSQARLNRSPMMKILLPIIGWSFAVGTHATHNAIASLFSGTGGLIIGTILDWLGWSVMIAIIIWALYREKQWIKNYLADEIALETISQSQYDVACSALSQGQARLNALFSGHYRSTKRFYQLCAELAYKK